MLVGNFDRLQVGNTHFSDFGAIYRKIAFSFEMVQKFGELIFDVLDSLLLLDPLG
jgi:hypothetical protein